MRGKTVATNEGAGARQAAGMAELTLRGVILGGLITLVFTAANVYLGLKIGLTFATSIPAAVISMAILRLFSTGTILENNIVQTIASAAGTLSAPRVPTSSPPARRCRARRARRAAAQPEPEPGAWPWLDAALPSAPGAAQRPP